jgi:hypothetical protein
VIFALKKVEAITALFLAAAATQRSSHRAA